MARRKRIYAWMLCFVIALVLFVSSAYAVHEAGHVCHGAGCRICETIRQAEALVQAFALIGGATLMATAFRWIVNAFRIADGTRALAPCTLISWKVRLND